MSREGLLVIVCGPSGVGKGTVLKQLGNGGNIRYSVSATTRSPRNGEQEGIHYFFKSVDEFRDMIEKDQFIEWTQYCENYYGTPRKYVEETLRQGDDVILEIEVVGAEHVKAHYPDVVSIFILPPSFEELSRRIAGRGTEKPEVIEKRLQRAREEIRLAEEYDYVIINDDLQQAAESIQAILKAEKHRYRRNTDIIQRMGIE